MPTDYPGALDDFENPEATDPRTNPTHAGQHTDANDAIEAIEAELGTDPAGSFATVKARLNNLGHMNIIVGAQRDVSGNTMTDHADFQFAVTAGSLYMVEVIATVSGSVNTTDYAFRFATSAGTMDGSGLAQAINASNSIAHTALSAAAATTTNTIPCGTDSDLGSPRAVRALYSFRQNTSNGTFSYQFAQNAAGGNTARTLPGSYMRWVQLA